MTLEKAFFILRHGSAEGEHKYFEAISVIENESNRQKAEIERLTAMVEAAEDYFNPLPFKNAFDKKIETAKAEAIKEFAERLKERADKDRSVAVNGRWVATQETIDNLVKEMAGEG